MISWTRHMVPIFSTILVAACAGMLCAGCRPASVRIESAPALIEAMRSRYGETWYHNLTFTQETIRLNGEVADTSMWYEALSIPGRLRIDIAPVDSGNGLLFAEDRRYVFQGGKLVFDRREIHPLLVLGFDVYVVPSAVTLAKLDSLGIDTSLIYEDEWDGRPVYVVGARPGESGANQFWVDKENLYFVRLLQSASRNPHATLDIRFSEYLPYGDAWVASRVDFLRNGTMFLQERYSDIVVDRPLTDSLFDPATWQAHSDWMHRR